MRRRIDRLLLCIPIVILIILGVLNSYIIGEIQQKLVEEQFNNMKRNVDLLAFSVNDVHLSAEDHKAILKFNVEYLDRLPKTYAALFTYTEEGGFILESNRYTDSAEAFNPFDYPEFEREVMRAYTGDLVVFWDDGVEPRHEHVYFSWSVCGQTGIIYLIVIGVSSLSIYTNIPWVVSGVIWINMAYALALSIWMVTKSLRRISYESK